MKNKMALRFIRQIPAWLRNKYLLTGVFFTVWLLFFDDRDVFTQLRHRRELHKLEESRDYYRQQIQTTRQELNKLKADPATLEKYAREKYRMKKDNEDLYLLPD